MTLTVYVAFRLVREAYLENRRQLHKIKPESSIYLKGIISRPKEYNRDQYIAFNVPVGSATLLQGNMVQFLFPRELDVVISAEEQNQLQKEFNARQAAVSE